MCLHLLLTEFEKKIKAGEVNKTLISVSRLLEVGFEANLGRRPYLRNVKTGRIIRLKRKGGMFILEMWINMSEGESTKEAGEKRRMRSQGAADSHKDFHRQGGR